MRRQGIGTRLSRLVTVGSGPLGGALSQGLSSLTNLLLVLTVAKTESPRSFGGFAIAYSVHLVIYGLVRAGVGETLSVTASPVARELQGRQAVGASALLGVGIALLVGVVSVVGLGPNSLVGGPLGVFALALPAVLMQDAARFAGFVQQRPAVAVCGDGVWLAVQVALMAVLLSMGQATALTLILSWGVSALVGTLAMIRQLGHPLLRGSAAWVWSNQRVSRSFGAEFGVQALAGHGTLYVVGAVVGLPAAGALRAVQSLYGPVNSMFMGLGAVLTPRAAQAATEGQDHDVLRMVLRATFLFATLGLTAMWVVLALPGRWGFAVLGETWPLARELAVPMGLVMASLGIISGVRLGLRAFRAIRSSLHLRMAIGITGLFLGTAGAIVVGVRGAAYGLAVAHLVCAAVGVIAFKRRFRPSAMLHDP